MNLRNNSPSVIWQTIIFACCGSLIFLLAEYTNFGIGGSVWFTHVNQGIQLLNGTIPDNPTYPMWGYSFLAGLFKNNVLYLQGVATVITMICWRYFVARRSGSQKKNLLMRLFSNNLFLVLLWTPYIFQAYSYESNSLSSLLAFSAAMLLIKAVEMQPLPPYHYFISTGILFGASANFRAENILLSMLLCFGIMTYGFFQKTLGAYCTRSLVFITTVMTMMIPWLLYSSFTTGHLLLSSTNAGGVMYLGLGVLPNNPWHIVASDLFVNEIAKERKEKSPWTVTANEYFKSAYKQAAIQHPVHFMKRIFYGWKLMIMQGVDIPNAEILFSLSIKDQLCIDYLREKAKAILGLNVNEHDIESFKKAGVDLQSVSLKHRLIFLCNFLSRALFTGLFFLLFLFSALLIIKYGISDFVSLVYLSFAISLLLVAGFIHSIPRHTTGILPIVITYIVLRLGSLDATGRCSTSCVRTLDESTVCASKN